MKKLIVLLFLLGCGLYASSQRYYITNLYMYDFFLVNPAFAAHEKSSHSFGAYYQNQWLGMNESPTTQMFNYQGPINGKAGMGSYIYNDRNGNMHQLGLHQAFSYEVILSKKRRRVFTLSFGLAMTAEQVYIEQDSFYGVGGVLDPAINDGNDSGWGFNASSGMLWKYNDYQLGFSVTNMLGQNNRMYLNDEEPGLPIDYHIYFGTMYKLNGRDIYLEPLLMYRQNANDDKRLDFTLKGTFPTPKPEYAVWGLVSYRRNVDHEIGKSLGLATTIGINYKRLSVGMEYQLGLTGAQLSYGSAYKIITKYTIFNNLKHRAIPCSEIRKNKRSRYSGLSW
ncbi:PorP/SprF family type IX secretion system membrane protein [Saccharicrinis fermentans]|uniref:Bacteroidetes-specific putative membrane protein n=1 Tax=Saccharicrinis fermentans DSM 9555 = JCM 21142 TaxID=869213 RepID=W7Y841_9BACT|nr:PorP/SprF family type IX secretion system membrane protein [Saccharicrinis fermentans]GAF03853.1 bacteroidetes-specific putative membrane protein [Saccharicrinis fermentans DSM 9555 = JCM 21142]